jgi:hypothetical protein
MLFVMGIDRWRTELDGQLPDTQVRPCYLHGSGRANSVRGDGALSAEPPSHEPPDVFLYNPLRPVPTVRGSDPARRQHGRALFYVAYSYTYYARAAPYLRRPAARRSSAPLDARRPTVMPRRRRHIGKHPAWQVGLPCPTRA